MNDTCYRCGITKKEFKRDRWVCKHWSSVYKQHRWKLREYSVEMKRIKEKIGEDVKIVNE